MDTEMMLNAIGVSVQGVPVFGFQPYHVDETTARDILAVVANDKLFPLRFNGILDSFAKHSYWEVDLGWFMRDSGLLHQGGTGAIMTKARELRPSVLQRNVPTDGELWVLGCFSTSNHGYLLKGSIDWDVVDGRHRVRDILREIELALKLVVSYVMESMINRPTTVYHTLAKRSVLGNSKTKAPRFRSVYLTDVGKQYLSLNPGHSGVKMPEHEVRGHWRNLRSGRTVFVRSHKRGDPSIPRRVIPVHVHH